jgi:hypothetical protein
MITKLKLYGLLYLFPEYGYQPEILIDAEPVKEPDLRSVIFETEELYTTVHEPNYKYNLPIQSILNEKYKVMFFSNNLDCIDLIKYCNKVEMFETDTAVETNYTIKVLGIEYSKIENSLLYQITIEYYKFQEQLLNIVNHLTYTENLRGLTAALLYKLELSNNKNVDSVVNFVTGSVINFYTCIVPTTETLAISNESSNEVAGVVIDSKTISFDVYNLRFYLTETEAAQMQKYAQRCFYFDSSKAAKGTKLRLPTGTEINAIERIKPVLERKTLLNIWECSIVFKYAKISYNNY